MFGDKISKLQADKAEKLDAVEALQELVEKEDRSFSEDEAQTRKDLIDEIKAMQERIDTMKETESLLATKAQPVEQKRIPITGAPVQEKEDPSLFFAKQAHALYMTGGNRFAAAEYAKESLRDDMLAKVLRTPAHLVEKASVASGDTTTDTWAVELVQVNQAASAFIDLLRPMSIVARFPGSQMSFGGYDSIKIPRKTTGSAGAWIGEDAGIQVDALAFDEVTLAPCKNANIITVTNELIARSEPSAMAIVRDDILAGIATSIDTKFVSSDAASARVSPAGLQTFDTSSTASGGDTLDLITADLKAAIGAMLTLNMPMMRPVWLIHPTRVNSLRFIRDGLGSYAFKDEIASGTLMGYPFMESTTVTDSVVMLVDASQVIIASDLAPVIDLSSDASLHMVDGSVSADIGGATTPVHSMFQLDKVAIRAKTSLDWNVRHANCVQVITSVSW